MDRLFLSPPDVGAAERELLLDAFDSNWIAPLGPARRRVRARVRRRSSACRHAAALSSGTAALHLALVLLGVGPGRRGARADAHVRGDRQRRRLRGRAAGVRRQRRAPPGTSIPALVDEELDERAARRARLPAAVIGVDLYGQCADYDPILGVVRARTACP